jgi:hypothetical protein
MSVPAGQGEERQLKVEVAVREVNVLACATIEVVGHDPSGVTRIVSVRWGLSQGNGG